jgi:hypothetical protein
VTPTGSTSRDATFGGCRADRVFPSPRAARAAIAQLMWVARPGARVVTIDPDFETGIVDAPERELTRRLLNLNYDSYRNSWIGRHTRPATRIMMQCSRR